ncbi:hypothetical protein CXG81DRAFT_12716 [Caulochytrium protostelioides]|uniref:RhoGAP-domain-containing protein n=1 Tax=Caulochytrium protostelioides TaxID=1555241 RepID=A0A4P9X6N9_9FUNG|nr:hypothetical protein CXG81DRAFT_12716 [Caulochytrium protostelioides]|eukprot:RKP00853.1 hypothetical protein CXG81DRAFT_12716 [Caulochytrium protostelioides]
MSATDGLDAADGTASVDDGGAENAEGAPNQDGVEALIRLLCDHENGAPVLQERLKQCHNSCKDVVGFLRKRALLEEDYGRQLAKMVKEFGGKESPKIYGREGSWTAGWTAFGAIHATVAQHHLELATALTELAEDVNTLSKDTERNRKQLRDDVRYQWKQVEDAVGVLEKSKQKYEASTHDWERTSQSSRIAQQAQGHGHSYGGHGTASAWDMAEISPMSLQKLQKNESGARSRATLANEAYRQQLFVTNGKRRDYYELHLPRLIRLLVDSIQKADDGLLRHLQGYVALYERCLMNEAMSTAPPSGQKTQPGMADVLGRVDLDGDLDAYVAVHLAEGRRVAKGDIALSPSPGPSFIDVDGTGAGLVAAAAIGSGAPGAFDATAVPMGNGNASRQYAGLDLITIADRDGEPVPVIVAALIQAIEAQGLAREGIYRVSGNSAHTARLLRRIDLHGTPPQPALRDEDRAVLTSALKQFFRELPDGLFPRASYRPLMQAMRNDDPQRRLMAVHEIINGLPDAHYGTIQVLFRHLAKVAAQEATNRMSADNLGLIWGPSLLMCSELSPDPAELGHASELVAMVIRHHAAIF